MPWNPENIFVATLALLAFPSPAQADLINHTYWLYISNPPLLQVVEWTALGLVVSSNDLLHMPPPWSLEGPSHPEEEGRLINISLAIKSFLYTWAQQNYVLMLVEKRGFSSCLQKRTSTHCLDCLLPCPFMRTMSKLPTL